MSRRCEVTGRGVQTGNNVSHAHRKTRRRFLPNLQSKRFWLESENRWVRLRVSHKGMRIIDKHGVDKDSAKTERAFIMVHICRGGLAVPH